MNHRFKRTAFDNKWRFLSVIFVLVCVLATLIGRMVYLTVIQHHFLMNQSNARSLRYKRIPAYRGMILSSDGNALAISIPSDSIIINPHQFQHTYKNIFTLHRITHLSINGIAHKLNENRKRYFMYLTRNSKPEVGKKIRALRMSGVFVERHYKRKYPLGRLTSHIVGMTNIDDQGISGLELAYNNWLKGTHGKQAIIKDRLGHVVNYLDNSIPANPGHNLVLSIDTRIQYLAYRALKHTVEKYNAKSGSVIVLNPKTGEILAMANQPDFDPNQSYRAPFDRYRNRAVTDMYEPGSTMKTFSIANALDSGKYKPDTPINTSPGWMMIGSDEVHDEHDNGILTVTQILQKSSSVGASKIALSLPPDSLINLLQRVGFGQRTASAFPGESPGWLPARREWPRFEIATLAFGGYGMDATPLQVAQAYAVIANHGQLCPITFLKRTTPTNCPEVISPQTADMMLNMLQAVVEKGGTGTAAAIRGYRVGGKTGTAYIADEHGYSKKRLMSSFAGIAPLSNPQFVILVVIRSPEGQVHFGGLIAAPAFQKVMSGALRIYNIAPDKL